MNTRVLSPILAALVSLTAAFSAHAGSSTAAIEAIAANAQDIAIARQEQIATDFDARVERDAGPRELLKFAKDQHRSAKIQFAAFQRAVKAQAASSTLIARRGGGGAEALAEIRDAKARAILDIKNTEIQLHAYIDQALETALNGGLSGGGDGGGGGGPPGPGDPPGGGPA